MLQDIIKELIEYLKTIPEIKKVDVWNSQFATNLDVKDFNQAVWPIIGVEVNNEITTDMQYDYFENTVTITLHVGDFYAYRDDPTWIFSLRDIVVGSVHKYQFPEHMDTPFLYQGGQQDTSHRNTVDYQLDFEFTYTDSSVVDRKNVGRDTVTSYKYGQSFTQDIDKFNGTNGVYRP